MMDGIINAYKPAGMTSHDAVAMMRKVLKVKKVGHTGTLDPMAEGVLPLCVGSATKVIQYLDLDLKTYRCRARLGVVTDTQDIWGEILEERDSFQVTEDDVKRILSVFRGTVLQKPPMYSAVKVKGKKLYEYAREGRNVDVKPRPVYIEKAVFIDLDEKSGEIGFDVVCGKGTYIRTICEETGRLLGCGAAMSSLKRLGSGIFTSDDATPMEKLMTLSPEEIQRLMVPSWKALSLFGEAELNEDLSLRFLNGQKLRLKDIKRTEEPAAGLIERYGSLYRVFGRAGGIREFLGVGEIMEGGNVFKAEKVFYTR